MKDSDAERAKTLLNKVISIDNEYSEAYISLGKLLDKQGHSDEAIEALKMAIKC